MSLNLLESFYYSGTCLDKFKDFLISSRLHGFTKRAPRPIVVALGVVVWFCQVLRPNYGQLPWRIERNLKRNKAFSRTAEEAFMSRPFFVITSPRHDGGPCRRRDAASSGRRSVEPASTRSGDLTPAGRATSPSSSCRWSGRRSVPDVEADRRTILGAHCSRRRAHRSRFKAAFAAELMRRCAAYDLCCRRHFDGVPAT
jgi:hypothetical protein